MSWFDDFYNGLFDLNRDGKVDPFEKWMVHDSFQKNMKKTDEADFNGGVFYDEPMPVDTENIEKLSPKSRLVLCDAVLKIKKQDLIKYISFSTFLLVIGVAFLWIIVMTGRETGDAALFYLLLFIALIVGLTLFIVKIFIPGLQESLDEIERLKQYRKNLEKILRQ